MRSALNQYLNPQIPARIVSVGQKLVKITARGRNIEAAEATVLEVKRTYALVDDGFDFGPRTVNRDTGFERRSAHNAANVRFLAPSALADVERRQQLQDAMPETDLYALFAKAPTELLAQLVDWAAEQ